MTHGIEIRSAAGRVTIDPDKQYSRFVHSEIIAHNANGSYTLPADVQGQEILAWAQPMADGYSQYPIGHKVWVSGNVVYYETLMVASNGNRCNSRLIVEAIG